MVSPDLLGTLRKAATRATDRAREGNWPHGIRTVASMFPPYSDDASGDVWGIHTLLHPDMAEGAFLEFYGSNAVRSICAGLLGVGVDGLQMELANMLVNPERTETSLPWHRDCLANSLTTAEEIKALAKDSGKQSGVQWNTALYTDSCFIFVPGSHIRPRTAVEREVTLNRPYDPLPTQMVLTLEAGQTVFYNPNLLHRAVYNPKIRRATLHCAVGAPENGGVVRAAGIVHVLGYKRISWITDPAFRDSLPNGGLRSMHANLLDSLQ